MKSKIQRLTRAGLETLAIIAYKQPCSTPEIERIRGVNCGGVLSTLLERNIVSIKGRSDGPGRPLLYGTTKEFLKYFGLNSLDDLPRIEELEAILAERASESMTVSQLSLTDSDDPESTGTLVLKRAMEQGVVRRFTIDNVVCGAEPLGTLGEGSGNGGNGDGIPDHVAHPEPAHS